MFAIESGRLFTAFLSIVAMTFGVIVIYAATLWLLPKFWSSKSQQRSFLKSTVVVNRIRPYGLIGLVASYALAVATHFFMIGFIPIVSALSQSSDVGVSVVRQAGYFELPSLMRYVSDYCVKAVGPALLLITYYLRSRLFWVVLLIGSFYSLALFTRMQPVIFLAPLLVYMLLSRRWAHAVITGFFIVVMLMTVTSVSSITIREALQDSLTVNDEPRFVDDDHGSSQGQQQDWRRTSALYAVYERALIVPGRVMDQWFQFYSQYNRFERGCGYRALAELLGCDYVHIPNKLYAEFYPDHVAQGMKGSLNSAHFMTDFANWGYWGLLASSLSAGLLFALIAIIYGYHPLALPMNLPLIVAAMESNLMTAVNSGGGWLVMTLLFMIFFRLSRH